MTPIPIIGRIENNIIYPLIYLLGAVAALLFFWGLFQFLWFMDSDEKRSSGQQHMLWGVVGFAIMLSATAIIAFIKSANVFG